MCVQESLYFKEAVINIIVLKAYFSIANIQSIVLLLIFYRVSPYTRQGVARKACCWDKNLRMLLAVNNAFTLPST